MRRQAAESDLVIVNHHLLCADAAVRQSAFGEVIPSCRYAVIDEAHQLRTSRPSISASRSAPTASTSWCVTGRRILGANLVADAEQAAELRDTLGRIEDRTHSFFGTLSMNRRGGERSRINAATLAPVADQGDALVGTLDTLAATLALLGDVPEDVLALSRRGGELRDQLRFLLRAADPNYVYFLEGRGPRCVSPRIANRRVLDRTGVAAQSDAGHRPDLGHAGVEGSFDYIRGRLGIGRAHEVQLPSEFDYTRQAILYLPHGMPEPRSPGFGQAAGQHIVEILKRTKGRAFVLLRATPRCVKWKGSWAQARATRSLFRARPTLDAASRIRETPHAVLLATSSFWHGVDVAGDALSCVIIDKLPFASPGEPITAARIEALANRGADPFLEYQMPLAILTLQQGLGRLIRHRRDRGVLAILDPRIQTRGYGRRFVASLPPAPVTHDLAEVERFLDG